MTVTRLQIHALTLLLSAATPVLAESCSLSLGVVPQFEQRKLLEIWQPIMNDLEVASGCEIHLSGSENIPDFEAKFADGRFDLAYMNPYHAVVAHRTQGYEPILRSSYSLQGVLVVASDSGIKDIQELEGKVVAFPSPNALGASLLMRAELKTLHQIDIEPRYVKTHPSVYLHVAKGLVSAGGGIQRTLDEQPEAIRSRLNTIYTTRMTPAHPLVIHPRIDGKRREALIDALLAIAGQHPDYFAAIPMQDPQRTSFADYQPVVDLHLEQFQE